MGWRYFVIAMGGLALIMFFIRFVLFTIYESPKYHMGKGRDDEAVRIVHLVAKKNGKTSTLTIEDLKACEIGSEGQQQGTDAAAAIKRKLAALNGNHVKALFATKKLAFSTASIMCVWAFIGLAFPLYVCPSILWSFPSSLPPRLPSSMTIFLFILSPFPSHSPPCHR